MALSDPQQRWPARAILVLGFVAIAAVSFAAGWLVAPLVPRGGAGNHSARYFCYAFPG